MKSIQELLVDCELDQIDVFSNGLQKKIEFMGRNLSLGEKQLIALLRVAAENRPIIVLDECTGSLDEVFQRKIDELLSKIIKVPRLIS